jgi:hypothetical protein
MKQLITISILFFFSISSKAQITFEKVIDTLTSNSAMCVQPTFDGGYIYSGGNYLNGNDAMVVKLDSLGSIEWTKSYGGPNGDLGSFIEQTSDSGYILNGNYNFGLNAENWLLKLDKFGDTLWTRKYSFGNGGTRVEWPNSMSIVNTNVIGTVGTYTPIPFNFSYSYIITYLSNGLFLNSRFYNFSNYGSEFYAINNGHNNTFVATGYHGFNSNTANAILANTDVYGDTLWSKKYYSNTTSFGKAVCKTNDGGYIVGGAKLNSSNGRYNMYVIKTDSIGDTLWTRNFISSESEFINSIIQTTRNTYSVVGQTLNSVFGAYDIKLMELDLNGYEIWTRVYGNSLNDNSGYIKEVKDGYIIAGETSTANGSAAYIIKTDTLGNVNSTTSLNETNKNTIDFSIYPNPTNGILHINNYNSNFRIKNIEIYNSFGQLLVHTNSAESEINLNEFEDGLYHLVIYSDKGVSKKNFVLSKYWIFRPN